MTRGVTLKALASYVWNMHMVRNTAGFVSSTDERVFGKVWADRSASFLAEPLSTMIGQALTLEDIYI